MSLTVYGGGSPKRGAVEILQHYYGTLRVQYATRSGSEIVIGWWAYR